MPWPKGTVYLIDDDDAVRDSLKVLLEACGFAVEAFASGPAFLDRYRGELDGCVLLDLHLPLKAGLQTVADFRARGMRLPTIMVTGRSNEEAALQAGKAGATALLEKPVDEAALLASIGGAMAVRSSP